jgi:alkanesulfonate monooxygenase SsuD/methylene tetrahydromethanopterin reductase-like flavin-dependent oxidoreductase (luciferase family)
VLIGYFNEMPYTAFPEGAADQEYPDDHPARKPGVSVVLLSNRHYNAAEASRLYNERLAHLVLCEEVGFDVVCINEHHNAVFCMASRVNILSTAVAAQTSRIKIMQIGNPISIWENPIWLSEEIAMIDLISKGRVIAGFVRGSGQEYFASNSNPAYSRARFDEAHDLMVKIWTTPGPFSWDGPTRNYRVVNPWVLPLQKPHPRIVIPGHLSKHGVTFAATHGYPYVLTNTAIEPTLQVWELYDQIAREHGYESGPQHRGHVLRVFVADTTEQAERGASQFYWDGNPAIGVDPIHFTPAGYSPWDDRKGRMAKRSGTASLERQVADGTLLYGTPTELVKQLRTFVQKVRPGILILETNEGRVSFETGCRSLQLLGTEVLPALRDMAAEFELVDPFQIDAPVGLGMDPPRHQEPIGQLPAMV